MRRITTYQKVLITLLITGFFLGVFLPKAFGYEYHFKSEPTLVEDYRYAINYWGNNPKEHCGTITKLYTDATLFVGGTEVGAYSTQGAIFEKHKHCELVYNMNHTRCEQRYIIVHETGHLIGLMHVNQVSAVMYPKLYPAIEYNLDICAGLPKPWLDNESS